MQVVSSVCVWGGAIMGIKELKPRRKYEKEIAKWPPFFMCEY